MPAVTDTSSDMARTTPESRLRAIRRGRGLTGEELAARAGLSLKTIYSIEVDGVRPQRATRRVLALALGITVEDIFPINQERAGRTNDDQGAHNANQPVSLDDADKTAKRASKSAETIEPLGRKSQGLDENHNHEEQSRDAVQMSRIPAAVWRGLAYGPRFVRHYRHRRQVGYPAQQALRSARLRMWDYRR